MNQPTIFDISNKHILITGASSGFGWHLEEYDFLESFHYKKIADVLIYENELKSRLITYNSADFYEHLCENYPEIIQQVPSKYIAEFMRISPGWLSKLKAKT